VQAVTVYVDTSALAKWYLNEPRSDEFEAFISRRPDAAISRLTVVEFRCLLARRRRAGDITPTHETRIGDTFATDIAAGALAVYSVEDSDFQGATTLIGDLRRRALRTLDALHLAVARRLDAELVATADRVMAAACKNLAIETATFY
jgi:predicted nucleic acid-binding protein